MSIVVLNKRLFLLLLSCVIYSWAFTNELDPYALRIEALKDFDQGNVEDAQKKQILAYELFMAAKEWDMASLCLYERAIEYLNIQDLANMWQQVEQLYEINKHHHSALVAYNYHSVASGYYSTLDSVKLAIFHGELAINALEQIENPQQYNIMPIWSYYNQALIYDMLYQPPMVDSVKLYLDKAREVIAYSITNTKDSLEALISVVDLEAWQEYYVGNYKKAERMMMDVLTMIDTVAKVSPNTIITERGEAYAFLAMLYEKQGMWRKALEYQKKLNANNEQRYDVDKRRVLQETQIRYAVAKQQLEMEKLEAKNRSRGWLLVVFGLLALVLAMGYGILVMRKKNADAKLYEAALETDNMRQTISELESRTKVDPLRFLVEGLVSQLEKDGERDYTDAAISGLRGLDLVQLQVFLNYSTKLTTMDKRYILCFAAGMSVEQIANFMCLEEASVYTVRYRIRKKMGLEYPFPY